MYFTQIEGDLLRRGIDLFDFTVREVISVTESWFLSHFAPHEWTEVREKLESSTRGESTTIMDSQGSPIPVSRKALDDMQEMLAAAGGLGALPEDAGAESADPS